jgi:hypothetical protein
MTDPDGQVDDEIPTPELERLRSICLSLREVVEEPAWTGVRWRVGRRTFAQVVLVDPKWPPVYARVVRSDQRTVVVTFQSPHPDLFRDADPDSGRWYFGFGRDAVGVRLDATTDWTDIESWITDSYRLQAPRRLGDALGPR